MKFNTTTTTTTTTLLLFATPILAGVAPAATAEQCGDLGVMAYTAGSLDTKGVDPAQIRKCREHPLGANPRPEGAVGPSASSTEIEAADFNASDAAGRWWWRHGWGKCWNVDPGDYGCSRGYCYSANNGDGRWCWTARNQGYGSWNTCNGRADCAGVDRGGCGRGCRGCGWNC